MVNRLRLLKGSTALLYVGPLLAGLGGFGWAVVYAFTALFMLWLFILRPQQWPRKLADWLRPEALISLLTKLATQILFVAICFGIGRGLGGVLGNLPQFPLMLPLGISFLSIPLARMIWDPWQADRPHRNLDQALAALEPAKNADETLPLRERVVVAERLVHELAKLPADSDEAQMRRHLLAISTQTGHDALRVALMDAVYDGTATALIRRAAVVHATEPLVLDEMKGASYPLAVFRELKTADDMGLFATCGEKALAKRPTTFGDFPDLQALRDSQKTFPKVSAALALLAHRLEASTAGVA
jgi:hypothetical protein